MFYWQRFRLIICRRAQIIDFVVWYVICYYEESLIINERHRLMMLFSKPMENLLLMTRRKETK